MSVCRLKATHAVLMAVLLLFMSACTSAIPGFVNEPTPTPSSATEELKCSKKFVPPKITEVQPGRGKPGSDIKVLGAGGYEQDTCGGYDESARDFGMYLDGEPVEALQCYINHCEAKLTLPSTITPGKHCLSLQKDACELEFVVSAG